MPATAQAAEEKTKQGQKGSDESKTQAQAVDFPEASETNATGAGGSLDILLDMSIPVTVNIGSTQMPIRQLLHLGQGSVVKLDKPVDAPMDLYLKNTKFATGNVVVVDGQFAVKIKQILSVNDSAGEEKQ